MLLVVCWASYCKWKSSKELKEPLYIKYKTDYFRSEGHYKRNFFDSIECPICRKYYSYGERSGALCHACWERIKNEKILKEQGIRLDVMDFYDNKDLLPILNLVQIDLQRGSITESDAKRIMDETAKEMKENATYYRRAKKAAGSKRLTYDETTFYQRNLDTKCLVCGREWGNHVRSCSSCKKEYDKDLKAKKFPNKLKEILNKISEVIPRGGYLKYSLENYFTYSDWRYLHLIAMDLERGFIEKSEALSEAERYIDLIYNDIKDAPAEIAAQKDASPEPIVKSESEKFMDDILS